jgi:hypothetical protein
MESETVYLSGVAKGWYHTDLLERNRQSVSPVTEAEAKKWLPWILTC